MTRFDPTLAVPAPGAPLPATPGQAAAPASNPHRRTAIIGLVLALFFPTGVIGLVVSFLGFRKLKATGQRTGVALAGMVIGGLATVVGIAIIVMMVSMLGNLASVCAEYGPGVHKVGAVTYTCS